MTTRRTFLTAAGAAPLAVALTAGTATADPGRSVPRDKGGRTALTNLAHLRFLLDEVPLPPLPTHTTHDIGTRPTGLAPWTYADADGATFRRVGGGSLDPATGHWTQGAYNADDITRAAVVFLRAWKATGDTRARDEARDLLRTLTYLQNASGPDAGRVVLWQQSDGALNPSAIPVELPDPSDSAESYWLARTVWALGEGYAAFRSSDPKFAAFLLARLHLCLDALDQESLGRYGTWVLSDGRRLPAWLIAGGADATAEAMLGLVAALRATPSDRRIARALDHYGEGVAAMATSRDGGWPFGAILPWTGSLGFWHAWGAAAPEALGKAGALRRRPDWRRAAIAEAGTFTPLLLACGGPANAWAPVPAEAQIAYGAHGRVAAAMAAAEAGGGPGMLEIAGLAAGWFFGANTARVPVYNPATGVTFDGVETDGRINRNSGAESTIHGLLAMQILDANRRVASIATAITGIAEHHGLTVLPASAATLSAGCEVVRPEGGAWTGEGNLIDGGYVHVPAGEWVEFDVESAEGKLHPLAWRTAADAGKAEWRIVGGRSLGSTLNGGTGPAGLTESDGSLVPQELKATLPEGRVRVRCTSRGELRLNALLVRPAVATARYSTTRSTDTVVYVSSLMRRVTAARLAKGEGTAYDADGRERGAAVSRKGIVLAGGGFSVTS